MADRPTFHGVPTNQNLMQSTRFQLNFSRLPAVSFFCQTFILPSVSAGYATSPTPFVDMKLPGEKLQYDSLNLTFLVDEDMANWREIHNWMRAYTFPKDFSEYRNLAKLSDTVKNSRQPQYSDAILTVYNNAWLQIAQFKFYDVFPTSLSGINFSTQDTPDSPVMTDATFDYTYYDIEFIKTIS
jgi:hypothetical protein